MKDTIGLIFVVLLLCVMGLLAALKLRRYDSDADKCKHGFLVGAEDFRCHLCDEGETV